MFQLYIHYIPCSFQCIYGDVADDESVSARRHAMARLSNARRISCGHAAINIVVCRAVLQQVAAADGHQPFVSHFSLTCLLIKTSMRRNLTTTIVFDELVVKGEQAHQRH